ncbi:hypothetical protein LTR36_009703 [Oleoguttula mirabilis]|uniref:Rhodopsin domain-containing protein n=1 Tax=Oleoguttula mirabilis TaxID=1507867 RepID=A0AAV9J5S5_9PEZI|nr:hypothetical protein LTR36_009703 [Oleoguttula mirabilis]
MATDITWENPMAAIYSSTEVNIGIICSCLPTLKGCVAHFFPRLFPERTRRSTVELRPVGLGTSSSGKAVNYRSTTWDKDFGRRPELRTVDDGRIEVVTVLEQESASGRKEHDPYPWESESVHNLVSDSPFRKF